MTHSCGLKRRHLLAWVALGGGAVQAAPSELEDQSRALSRAVAAMVGNRFHAPAHPDPRWAGG